MHDWRLPPKTAARRVAFATSLSDSRRQSDRTPTRIPGHRPLTSLIRPNKGAPFRSHWLKGVQMAEQELSGSSHMSEICDMSVFSKV